MASLGSILSLTDHVPKKVLNSLCISGLAGLVFRTVGGDSCAVTQGKPNTTKPRKQSRRDFTALTSIRRMFAIKGEHFQPITGSGLSRRYVRAMAWNELTTSSGPASVKKLS
jgi:hypothetical protein